MTGGLGNQMFIYAMFLRMKKHFPHTRIDISDMVHYHVHHGYEMNTIFNLPHDEFCISQPLKKILEFFFLRLFWSGSNTGRLPLIGTSTYGLWSISRASISRSAILMTSRRR